MAAQKRSKSNIGVLALVAALGFIVGAAVVLLVAKYSGVRITGQPPAPPQVAEAPAKPRAVPPEKPAGPRVAIVIDDLGADLARLKELIEINAPLTMAVLPHLAHSTESAFNAHTAGREVIMHLPMEPEEIGVHDPGPGALLVSMTDAEVARVIEDDLGTVPYATGVNNHMGSRFTADAERMRAALEVIRDKRMFFLDSRTTPDSVAMSVASDLGIKTAGRSVFLDNTREDAYIEGQINELVRAAGRNGSAIAIGHPYPETVRTLAKVVPNLKSAGVEVVPLSELVR